MLFGLASGPVQFEGQFPRATMERNVGGRRREVRPAGSASSTMSSLDGTVEMGSEVTNGVRSRSRRSSHNNNSLKFKNVKSIRPIGLQLCYVLLVLGGSVQAQSEPEAKSTNSTNETSPVASTLANSEVSLEPTPSPNSLANQPHKLKAINFTLVDELFHSTVNESELLRRWKNMDGQFQEGIRSILKLVFPQIVAISQDAKVSGDCSGGILKWILSLRNLRSWAIKMLDATGKPTAGIFEGSLTMFGNHRQCLSIRAPDEDEIEITDQFEEYFRGQFCVLHLRPWLADKKPFYHLNSSVEPLLRKGYKYYEKTLYDELAEIAIAFNFIDIRMDLCVPSTCTTADIQRVADLLSRKLEMRAKVMRCDIESRESSSTFVQHLDQTTKIWLVGPICLILVTLISTFIVMIKGSCQVADTTRNNLTEQNLTSTGLIYCMSLQGALSNLLETPTVGQEHRQSQTFGVQPRSLSESELFKKPTPLYGLRNVFVIWFIIVQLTIELKYQYLRESLVLRNMMLSYWPFQIIINTSMIFESLILITAFTYGYCNLKTSAKGLLGYIAKKYIRLAPAIVTLVLVTIVLPSIEITSPVWRNFVELQSNVCKSTGYLNLFFLQNFVSYDKICLPHTWLFCVEIQLIALSIPIVLLMQNTHKNCDSSTSEQDLSPAKNKPNASREAQGHPLASKSGLLGLALVFIGAGGNFVLVFLNQLPPAWFHTFPDAGQKDYYFSIYLTKAWTHLSTFVIGLYAGHLTRRCLVAQLNRTAGDSGSIGDYSARGSGKSLDNKRASLRRASFQIFALGVITSILFLTFSWSTQELPSPMVSGLYDSISRLIWSIALTGLMMQLCKPNYEGAYSRLSWLFCHPLCIILGRLSFLAYLLAPLVHTFVLAVQEQSLFPSLYLIFHVILGNIVITYLLAFVLSLMIEQPIRLLARHLSCCVSSRSRGSASISTVNATTTTSASSLTNER